MLGDARRALRFPIGLSVGTATLVVIYVVANIGYLAALEPVAVANSATVFATVVGVVGPSFAKLVAVNDPHFDFQRGEFDFAVFSVIRELL